MSLADARSAALLALLLWQAGARDEPPVARPERMRYVRSLSVASGTGQACAVLDAQIFPHASPALTDLRVFPAQGGPAAGAAQGGSATTLREIPYVITLSETQTEETQPARVLNLGTGGGGSIDFDLEMPDRAYTDVALELDGQDFLVTARVSGSDALGAGKSTALGVFTLFDLTSQRLSRDTTLPLQESTFRYLHVALSVSPAPGSAGEKSARFLPAMVEGAQVPPSREAQTVYTTVAMTSTITTVGRESRATFIVPERVPVERVSFELAPGFKSNFSRDVRVKAVAQPKEKAAGEDVRDDARNRAAPLEESVSGTILRVHTTQAGREIRDEQLSMPATLGANLQSGAKVEVDLENGDDQPLPVAAVRLEMRQRKLCFDVSAGVAGLLLYYGDPTLRTPVYDYERFFAPARTPLEAKLEAEQLNPVYQPPPAEVRPFTERHPEVLWIALIAVISVLAVVALKSSRNVGR